MNPLWKGGSSGHPVPLRPSAVMPAGYDTNEVATGQRDLRRVGHQTTIDRSAIELTGAREAAELRDQALRLLAVGVGDHTPIEVQEQVAEIARRLAQLEAPAHWWG
jgi:cytochrome c1